MTQIEDHPLRYQLSNELHARPFPSLKAPCHAVYLAIKKTQDAANRDRAEDRAHLIDLLDRFGAQHPQPDATHFFGEIGRYSLKWENHTEFVTYTIFSDGVTERPFDPAAFDVFPEDWLAKMPGARIASALIRVEKIPGQDVDLFERLHKWFVPDSLACSWVLDRSAMMASDFRIDNSGHARFALFVQPDAGRRRVGRIVQRLTEIEIYKAMSMLGLPRARGLSRKMGEIDPKLSGLVEHIATGNHAPEETLDELLAISARLENLQAQSAFRFGATGAYEALVHQRIEVLREERYGGRQTFREFMMRRFDPAMRTVMSTREQLRAMTERAARAGDLLRTQVDVSRSAQNQKLLESMDKRADLQLRLQETVEGLSVVAISYYAVSLAAYAAYPVASPLGLSKGLLTALLTPVVVLVVWMMIRRIRQKMH
ncbi:hypothetical protein ATO10_00245 [Actibacterium atlanticum]|uniref:Membrane-anchored protein n=1 Tax=Actibacterium atlanticum TaxID=1461693 RepID=A0A058ZNE3_9RHOB|nr:DUF3422 domain-containing protein [Actibacterium atlanticum]KCV83144.1 hypothetical protein ATO10_00245 [Actibacterium atlanticum]